MHLLSIITFLCGQILCQTAQSKCMFKFDLSACFNSTRNNAILKSCHNQNICKKRFNISYVRLEPYSAEIVADLLLTCCGSCLKYSITNTYDNVSEIPPPANITSHFVFPVLGRSAAVTLYGYNFIPLVETPSIYYITRKEDDVMIQLIISCLAMWPLVINCLLMMVLSGFIGWAMETWSNKEEFPRHFIRGWFEGIWWSFISMTTVGYGDKVPKTVLARLFSIVWILVGITTFSFVTAMLSSELTAANSSSPPTIATSKVGALRHHLYDAIFIARHGGVLVDINTGNTTTGIPLLIKKLKQKEIDGFILDRYTMFVFYRHATVVGMHTDDVNFLKKKTVKTEFLHVGERLSYGALVKNLDDYEFLADFVVDNTNVINTCNNLLINNFSTEAREETTENPLFSVSGKVFWPTFCAIITMLAIICCGGVVYEYRRQRKESADKSLSYKLTSIVKT